MVGPLAQDEPTGVEDDPPLRAWIQEPVRPATTYPERPGRWVGTAAVGETTRELVLGSGTEPVVVAAPDHTGIDAGRYFPFGNPTDLPPDQRAEDGRSVCFDLGPLPGRIEILGRPVVRLRLDADRPAAAVVVRLCTVDDDGASTLVTRGVLNLTRRHGRDRTVPWTPGVPETVEVPLMATGSAVPAGGRLRVAVSQAYWPWVWPHPDPVRLTVVPAQSSLTLPLSSGTDLPATTFGPPEQAPPLPVTTTRRRTVPNARSSTTSAPVPGSCASIPLRRLAHLPRRAVLRRGHPRDLPDHRRRPALGARRVGLDDRDRPRRLADRHRDPLGAHGDRHRLRRRELVGRPVRRRGRRRAALAPQDPAAGA